MKQVTKELIGDTVQSCIEDSENSAVGIFKNIVSVLVPARWTSFDRYIGKIESDISASIRDYFYTKMSNEGMWDKIETSDWKTSRGYSFFYYGWTKA